MRNSPVLTVDPTALPIPELKRVSEAANVAKRGEPIDFASLPAAVREQLVCALDAIAHGQTVLVVASGKPLTTTEAAGLLGMSRGHFVRLCDEGRIPSYKTGNSRRVDPDVIMQILRDRSTLLDQMRASAGTADERRRERAARAAAAGGGD